MKFLYTGKVTVEKDHDHHYHHDCHHHHHHYDHEKVIVERKQLDEFVALASRLGVEGVQTIMKKKRIKGKGWCNMSTDGERVLGSHLDAEEKETKNFEDRALDDIEVDIKRGFDDEDVDMVDLEEEEEEDPVDDVAQGKKEVLNESEEFLQNKLQAGYSEPESGSDETDTLDKPDIDDKAEYGEVSEDTLERDGDLIEEEEEDNVIEDMKEFNGWDDLTIDFERSEQRKKSLKALMRSETLEMVALEEPGTDEDDEYPLGEETAQEPREKRFADVESEFLDANDFEEEEENDGFEEEGDDNKLAEDEDSFYNVADFQEELGEGFEDEDDNKLTENEESFDDMADMEEEEREEDGDYKHREGVTFDDVAEGEADEEELKGEFEIMAGEGSFTKLCAENELHSDNEYLVSLDEEIDEDGKSNMLDGEHTRDIKAPVVKHDPFFKEDDEEEEFGEGPEITDNGDEYTDDDDDDDDDAENHSEEKLNRLDEEVRLYTEVIDDEGEKGDDECVKNYEEEEMDSFEEDVSGEVEIIDDEEEDFDENVANSKEDGNENLTNFEEEEMDNFEEEFEEESKIVDEELHPSEIKSGDEESVEVEDNAVIDETDSSIDKKQADEKQIKSEEYEEDGEESTEELEIKEKMVDSEESLNPANLDEDDQEFLNSIAEMVPSNQCNICFKVFTASGSVGEHKLAVHEKVRIPCYL